MAGPAADGSLDGPWFDDLSVGDAFTDAPAMTVTEAHAALHQAIVGDRLRLALDRGLARAVIGTERPLAHPALAWDVAIGQSTVVTGRVIANLFYRDLVFRHPVFIGDTLQTRTEVEALRDTSHRPGVGFRGLALLRIVTRNQSGQVVLDFRRCAMLPLREPDRPTGRRDSIDGPGDLAAPGELAGAVEGWRLDPLRAGAPGPAWRDLAPGQVWRFAGGDVVSSAPELARLTLNLATAHHDRLRPGGEGRRLVYGGHAIGIAAARAARALPTLATICGWYRCDHLGPVFEGDTLFSELELEDLAPSIDRGALARVRARVAAGPGEGDGRREVLDWSFAALLA